MPGAEERDSGQKGRGGPDECDEAITGTKAEAAEVCRAADWAGWSSEGIGIKGSKGSMLLFEFGSSDHEFGFVIMG